MEKENKSVDESSEQASLGSCLLSKEALDSTFEILKPDDYDVTAHQKIFKTMCDLIKTNKAVDLVTLTEELNTQGLLEKIGGVTYLTHLVNSVPTVANIEHYNSIVKKYSGRRKITFILNNLKASEIETEEALELISKVPVVEIAEETLKTLLKNTLLVSTEGVAHRFKIELLNSYLGGIDKGELITIGGFTSQGKTSFAIQLALDFLHKDEDKRVLYLTSEMTPLETSRRILANLMPKNIMDFRQGIFAEGEKNALNSIADVIGDHWNLNIKKIFDIEDIKKYIKRYKPEIVFVDYLQNLDRRFARSDYERVTGNIKDLQGITLSEELSMFVLSQLARNKEGIREPKITDLRDSGRIEECSNVILLLYWENRMKLENAMRKGGEVPERLGVSIVKNRDGTIGRMDLGFEPEYCRVRETEFISNINMEQGVF